MRDESRVRPGGDFPRNRFGPLIERPRDGGLFLDFDGTLSDIVFIPTDARPVEGARDALDRLASRVGLVVIVSGRAAGQLSEWLGPEVEIWGTHGAERARGGRVEIIERMQPYVALMREVKADAERALESLDLDGVILEDKAVMLSLHFRAASDRDVARRHLDELADDLVGKYGLKRAGGRLAFELRPSVELSKADVVLARAREAGLGSCVFIGDDRVDLPGFDALDELERDGVHAVRVAVDSAEAPPELLARADVVVENPLEVVRLLAWVATAIDGDPL